MTLPAGAGVGALVGLIGSMGTPGQPPQSYQGNCTDAGCHGDFAQRAVVHAPADDGSCDACHEPKEGPGHHFQLTYKEPDLCTECHDSFEGKVLHGPVAAGACTACHDPHASEHSGLLLAGDGPICLKCHTALAARLRDKAHQQAPAVEECTACHDPHVADNAMILHTTAPELCLDCHDSIADVIDEATATHDAVTEGKSCLACHDPHASDVEQILRKEPMDLCLGCHDRELTSGEGKIGNIKQLLKDHRRQQVNQEHRDDLSGQLSRGEVED